MTVHRRHGGLISAAALALLLTLGTGASPSLGRSTAQGTAVGSMATDVLDAPTSPTAGGGLVATLGWIPTTDTYAAGHAIYRATTSSGPYSQVGSTASRTVATYVDRPGAVGTYWYVIRAVAGGWTSAASSPVSATLANASTAFRPCTAQAAGAGGDGNGYETNAAAACAVDGAVASDIDSGTGNSLSCTDPGKDTHVFRAFGISLPADARTIVGITVRATARIDASSGANRICVLLSWDGGTSWTSSQQVNVNSTTLVVHTLGGSVATWGRTWAKTEFSDALFLVRLVDVSSNAGRDFFLDGVEVQVTYGP